MSSAQSTLTIWQHQAAGQTTPSSSMVTFMVVQARAMTLRAQLTLLVALSAQSKCHTSPSTTWSFTDLTLVVMTTLVVLWATMTVQTSPQVLVHQLTTATTSTAMSMARTMQMVTLVALLVMSRALMEMKEWCQAAMHLKPTPATGSSPTQTNCCRTLTPTTSQKPSTRQALGQSSCHTQIMSTTTT